MTERTKLAVKTAGEPRRRRSTRRGEKGQAALEFILILPIFIGFFLLIVDPGMLMYQYVSISNAVREGTRFGSVNCGDGSCSDTEVKTRTIDRSGGILDPLVPGDVTVGWVDNDGVAPHYSRGDSVVVSVNHRYDFLFFPFGMNVASCADMSLEQIDSGALVDLPIGAEC